MKIADGGVPSAKKMEMRGLTVCLQCESCGHGCSIADNSVSFVFDSKKKYITLETAPVICSGKCMKACKTGFQLVKMSKEIPLTESIIP